MQRAINRINPLASWSAKGHGLASKNPFSNSYTASYSASVVFFFGFDRKSRL